MSRSRRAAITIMALAGLATAVVPARAQNGDPAQARLRVGSFALSPAIRLVNMGWDSNVFNDSKDNSPKSDVMGIASPVLEAWLRTPRVRVNGHSQLDMYYFRELTSLRAVDNDHSGHVEFVLNRLIPYVTGNLLNTRHRHNLEIDAIVKRRNDGARAGTYVRLTGKSFVGLYAGRSRVEYEVNSLFRGTDLARALNHAGSHEGLTFRYEATPLTTFTVDLEQGRDRFEFSPERNSDSIRIGPSVEFKPLALVSGRAAIGFRTTTFRDAGQPDYKGTTASVDLQYSFRGRTQFTIGMQRDLEYSYLFSQRDYILTGLTGSVTQRVGDSWDVRGTVGRHRLTYRRPELRTGAQEPTGESFPSYGINLGYYIGRHRVGFDVQHQSRESDVDDGRGYERLRISSSVTYMF